MSAATTQKRLSGSRRRDDPQKPMLIIGHRGAAGLEPENTVPGFERALALGVDGVELDVHVMPLSNSDATRTLVVIHDDQVDRTTNGTGPLADYTYRELRQLDAGKGQPVPTLAEVLAVCANTLVNVELKGPDSASRVADVIAELRSSNSDIEFLVSSFDHDELFLFRNRDSKTAVAPLFGRWRDDAVSVGAELGAWSVNLSVRACTADRVGLLGDAGFRVLCYTVNDVPTALRLKAQGVDGLFTDYPNLLIDRC